MGANNIKYILWININFSYIKNAEEGNSSTLWKYGVHKLFKHLLLASDNHVCFSSQHVAAGAWSFCFLFLRLGMTFFAKCGWDQCVGMRRP